MDSRIEHDTQLLRTLFAKGQTHSRCVFNHVESVYHPDKRTTQLTATDAHGNRVEFILQQNYPFEPPEVHINGRTYHDFLTFKGDKQKCIAFLKQIRRTDCLCCVSLVCPAVWKPHYTVQDIWSEVLQFEEIKKEVLRQAKMDLGCAEWLLQGEAKP